MLSAANQFSADCIMNTRWWLQAPDSFLRTTQLLKCARANLSLPSLEMLSEGLDCDAADLVEMSSLSERAEMSTMSIVQAANPFTNQETCANR
jgi:hypothetical protein